MEQAEHINVMANEGAKVENAYERYGWMILSVSAVFGIAGALFVGIPSYYTLSNAASMDSYPILVAWGITWLGFNVFALVLALIPYKKGEQWAWFVLWLLPLLWLSLFALAPDLPLYLALAVLTGAGLVLPFRKFFPSP